MSITHEDELQSTQDRQQQCRICLDSDNPNDIISPCLCSGSSAYVHRKCLNDWRSENAGGKAFKFCDICQFEYIIETIINDPKSDRKRLLKYHLFVIRDLTSIILLVQSVIIGLAFLLKTIDKNDKKIKDLFPVSINGFSVYYLSASVLLLAILGLIVLTIVCFGVSSSNNRSFTRSNSFNSSGNSANGLLATVGVMVLICAFIGMLVGIILSVIILKKIMKHHTKKLWLRQEAEKYIVKDFQGRRNELEKYKKNLPMQSLIN